MPLRSGFTDTRTFRPTPAERAGALLPSIRDIVRLEPVAIALPEVIAGAGKLDTPVRWVHVTETADVANLLNGGELLLSTGVGWPRDGRVLRGYVAELVKLGVAGLVLELGQRFAQAPVDLVHACRELDFPLVVLHRQARFIAITEAVHAQIIADQMTALRARDEIHALFTELSLRGSPADFIVSQVGHALRATVVLENLNHQVVAVENQSGDDVLQDWEQRSRAARRSSEWLITPVEARGIRWGYLIALPGQPHPAGRSNVLEQAAVALALSRLADKDADEWTRQSHQYLLHALLGGRFSSETGLVARFEAAGVPVRRRRLIGIAVATTPGGSGPTPLAATLAPAAVAAAQTIGADAVAGAPPTAGGPQLIVALSLPPGQPLGRQLTDEALDSFAARLAEETGIDGAGLVVAVGAEAVDIPGLLASIEEAAELVRRHGRVGRRTADGHPTVYRVEDRPLLRFLNSFGSDPRLQAHSEQMLRPLIEHDLEHGGDLLDVLRAYAAHPGNRTKAATSSHLSRSVFYQRIALIEELLGADLDDGEIVSALHTALLARRVQLR
ncbi:MAG: PucR family transcriptional regulator [Microbacteriaceae bacterium]